MLLLNKNIIMCLCLLCIGVVLSSLSGCASRGAYFSTLTAPQNDKAVLYVYRKWAFTAGGVNYQIEDNNEKIVPKLSVNSYLYRTIEPREHIITTDLDMYGWVDGDVTFVAEPNKKYFVRLETSMIIDGVFSSHFYLVPEELALDELKEYRLAL